MMSALGHSPVPNGVMGSASPPPDTVRMRMMFALFGSTENEVYWNTSPTDVRFGLEMNASSEMPPAASTRKPSSWVSVSPPQLVKAGADSAAANRARVRVRRIVVTPRSTQSMSRFRARRIVQ
jgi:hypothetical protein